MAACQDRILVGNVGYAGRSTVSIVRYNLRVKTKERERFSFPLKQPMDMTSRENTADPQDPL